MEFLMRTAFCSILLPGLAAAAAAAAAVDFPACVLSDTTMTGEEDYGLKINVANFLEYGALPEGCSPDKCSDTVKFGVKDAASCAMVCSKSVDCQQWTFGVESTMYKCWLWAQTAGQEFRRDFSSGARECSPSIWPDCIEQETIIRNAGKAVWFDATVFGSDAIDGCYASDCSFTDKFIVNEPSECGSTCAKLPDCEFWTYGQEDGLTKCWLRTADDGREHNTTFISGNRACGLAAPERRSKWTQGENNCWGAGFTEDMCCDEKYGPSGNPACWDAAHTFEMCCLGHRPYWQGSGDAARSAEL
ncbi:hypothetical protein FOZ60_005630 [Perkinsus olseni]|uniref:Apple domain-containing protein n=1 Tax=Perkinsus olseni TaxID=32597 RepID=A0A7J6NRI1_PEROL|nr:hypothetical protein FOZ60_005630 [Perkinsus olseni]